MITGTATIVGERGLVPGKMSSQFSPTRGATTTYIYRGNKSDIINQSVILQNNKWETNLEQGAGDLAWTLTATYPEDLLTGNPGIPDPLWTIEPHAIERHILDCDDRPFVASLSTSTKQNIELAIKQSDGPLIVDPDSISELPNALKVYNLMRKGTEARQEFTVAVKRKMILGRFNNFAGWASVNNDLVLSKNFLVNNYFVDAPTAFSMPDSSFSIETDNNGVDFFWGYLEQNPTRTEIGNQQICLEQLWVYNKWSAGANGLYDVIS